MKINHLKISILTFLLSLGSLNLNAMKREGDGSIDEREQKKGKLVGESLEKANRNVPNNLNVNKREKGKAWCPLVYAARYNLLEEFQELWVISKQQSDAKRAQQQAFITACMFDRYEFVTFMLEQDPSLKDCQEIRSGLPATGLGDHNKAKILSPLLAATITSRPSIVKLLLEHEVSLHCSTFDEDNDPLHSAIEKKDEKVATLLLEARAYDCDTFASNPLLPFLWAKRYRCDQQIFEKLLVYKDEKLKLDDKHVCCFVKEVMPTVRVHFDYRNILDYWDWRLVTFLIDRFAHNDSVRLCMAQRALIMKYKQTSAYRGAGEKVDELIARLGRLLKENDAIVSLDLITAIAEGNKDQLKTLIEGSPGLLNQQTYGICGKTPLNWACYFQQLGCVEFLCSKGADVTMCSESDVNDSDQSLMFLSPFLTALLCTPEEEISLKIPNFLITQGVNVNELCQGERPIDICVRFGNMNAIKFLITMNADVRGVETGSPFVQPLLRMAQQRDLFLAAKTGNEERIAELERYFSPKSQIFLVFTGAVQGNQFDLVKKMCAQESLPLDKTFFECNQGTLVSLRQFELKELKAEVLCSKTPLGFAACHGLKEVAEVLLQAGADGTLESYDELVRYPLIPFVSALLHGHYELARTLLVQKKLVDKKDSRGRTAFDYVMQAENKQALVFLLNNGACYTSYYSQLTAHSEVQAENELRYQNFIFACQRGDSDYIKKHWGHFVVTKELAQKYKNPLICAYENRKLETFRLLLSMGFKFVGWCDGDHFDYALSLSPEFFKAFIESNKEPSLHRGLSCIAALRNQDAHLKILLDAGMVGDPKDLLAITVRKKHKECFKLLISFQQDRKLSAEEYALLAQDESTPEITTMLMQPDVHREQIMKQFLNLASQEKYTSMPNFNIQDSKGKTLLHRAIDENNQRAFEYLLGRDGVDVNKAANDGMSPLMSAAHQGNERAVDLLYERGASVKQEDLSGCQAYQYAARQGHIELARGLLAKEGLGAGPLKKEEVLIDEALKAGFAEDISTYVTRARSQGAFLESFVRFALLRALKMGYNTLVISLMPHCEKEFAVWFLSKMAMEGNNLPVTAACIKSLSAALTPDVVRQDLLKRIVSEVSLSVDHDRWNFYKECQKLLSSGVIFYLQYAEQLCEAFVRICAEFKRSFKAPIGSAAQSQEYIERSHQFSSVAIRDNGQTLLMWACIFDDIDTLKKIISAGVPESYINHQDKDGKTALMYAVMYGNVRCIDALICWERKAEPGHYDNLCSSAMNVKDADNKSVLWYAAQLAKYDRPMIIRDAANRQIPLSAMDYSRKCGALKIFNLLDAAGARLEKKKDLLETIKIAAEHGCNELAVTLLGYCYPDSSPERQLAHIFI